MENDKRLGGARGSMRGQGEAIPIDVICDLENMMGALGIKEEDRMTVDEYLRASEEDIVEDPTVPAVEVEADVLRTALPIGTDSTVDVVAEVVEDEDEEEGEDGEEEELEDMDVCVVTLDQARERVCELVTFCRENNHIVSTEMADVVESIGERLQGVVVTARMRERKLTSYFEKVKEVDSMTS